MFWFALAQIFTLVLDLLALVRQSDREKDVEILLLRQQLRILERKQARPPRFSYWEKQGLAVPTARLKALTLGERERLRQIMVLFQPETDLKWHRDLVRRKWIYQHAARLVGNTPLDPEVETLTVQLVRGNPRFGYVKLVSCANWVNG